MGGVHKIQMLIREQLEECLQHFPGLFLGLLLVFLIVLAKPRKAYGKTTKTSQTLYSKT